MNYLVSDFIIRIKNSVLSKRKEVILPFSNLNKEIAKVLVKEGYLESVKETSKGSKRELTAIIKYEKRIPIFTDVIIISKPSLRVYSSSKKLPEIEKRGRRTIILSTSQGVMTGKEAVKKGLGGEILFSVW